MSVTRLNVVDDQDAHDTFVAGVLALKAEFLGSVTTDFGIPGRAEPVSTYDLFTIWHHLAMGRMTPSNQNDRNAAHSGPAFLPWHRLMLVLLEIHLQRVLSDPTVALPYWDWAADGALPPSEQAAAPLWRKTGIGGSGRPVADGPFRADAYRVRIESDALGQLRTTDRGLTRELGADPLSPTLPTPTMQSAALGQTAYDAAPWSRGSSGFRSRLEGWTPFGMHNQVHVWVGGDMAPATSPNDPVFYLNHCNVDRIWEAWMTLHGRTYIPLQSESADLTMHRLDDPLYSILINQAVTPADVLDVSDLYVYDALPSFT